MRVFNDFIRHLKGIFRLNQSFRTKEALHNFDATDKIIFIWSQFPILDQVGSLQLHLPPTSSFPKISWSWWNEEATLFARDKIFSICSNKFPISLESDVVLHNSTGHLPKNLLFFPKFPNWRGSLHFIHHQQDFLICLEVSSKFLKWKHISQQLYLPLTSIFLISTKSPQIFQRDHSQFTRHTQEIFYFNCFRNSTKYLNYRRISQLH